jgi:hypothetical protein
MTEKIMIDRRALIAKIGLCGFLAANVIFVANSAAARAASGAIAAFDKDNDGTLDLAEAKAAASDLFDKLNKDPDDTLDAKEVGGRLNKKKFAAADPDHDGTLTKEEYLAVVEKLFKAADVDNEGTLSARELHSKAGRALVRLLRLNTLRPTGLR